MSLRAENSRYLKFEFSKINEFGIAKCFDFLLLKQNQHQKRIFMHKNNVSQVFLMQEKQHTSIKITNLPNFTALTKKSLRAEKNFKRNSTTMSYIELHCIHCEIMSTNHNTTLIVIYNLNTIQLRQYKTRISLFFNQTQPRQSRIDFEIHSKNTLSFILQRSCID